MSKNYQKAARGCLYALAVVIAGVCFSVKPAQSATCFLPSGNCSTGKIGGGPAPEATPEYCTEYNINQTQYNQNSKKYSNTSCFSCTYCTKTVDDKGTYYKCDKVSNSTWYDYDGGVCCTNGTKYDTKYKTCCASGDCTPTCPAGQFWSDLSNDCVCSGQAVKDKNGNCCAKGQVLDDDGNCTTPCEMNDCGDYPYTTDPGNSESCNLGCNKGYRYKCKTGYTYSNGKCEQDKKCDYEYVHLTFADTGTTNYDRQNLRYGIDGEICTKAGTKKEFTSTCSGNYFCGNSATKCDTPGKSCKFEAKCSIYRDCEFGSKCWKAIMNNKSIVSRLSGTPEWGTLYNKISNTSARCWTKTGTPKYETLCEGTIKEKCNSTQKFVPNGCISNTYSDGGVYVAGTQWGTCGCDNSKGFYDNEQECKNATGKNCTSGFPCYQTCEALGYYSTEEACLTGKTNRQQCEKKYNDCYVRKTLGFTITQSNSSACGGWTFGLITPDGQFASGNGVYDSGEYSIVIYGNKSLIHFANISGRQTGGVWCFGDQAEDAGCGKTAVIASGSSTSSKHYFNDGEDYVISVSCK